jgi:hypothetical protein
MKALMLSERHDSWCYWHRVGLQASPAAAADEHSDLAAREDGAQLLSTSTPATQTAVTCISRCDAHQAKHGVLTVLIAGESCQQEPAS